MSTHSRVEAIAINITKKHGFNQCRPCATELRKAMMTAGKKGVILLLTTKGGRGYIVMKDPEFVLPFNAPSDTAISDTGQHFGVHVDDYVFDNIHRKGILMSLWKDTFDCDVHAFEVVEIEPF